MIRLLALALLVGCGKASNTPVVVDSADSAEPESDEPEGLSCEETTINVIGEDAPGVGDSWTVWLYCDDTLLAGVMVLSFDPVDFASLKSNTATFLMAGTATMRLQVGSHWAEQEVTVTK